MKRGTLFFCLTALFYLGSASRRESQVVRRRGLQEPPAGGAFPPITDFVVVYGSSSCPADYDELLEDLNSGGNGDIITICYATGGDDGKLPISDIRFSQNAASCPQGWETVLTEDGEQANLNKGTFKKTFFGLFTTRRSVSMCYLRSGDDPIYHLRVLNRREPPRLYEVHHQDINAGLSRERLYVSFTRSPSMLAALISMTGKGNEPRDTLPWSEATEDSGTGTISIDLHFDCERNGDDMDPGLIEGCSFWPFTSKIYDLDEIQSNRLCQLAMDGMNEVWSGSVTVKGVTRYVEVNATFTSKAPSNKDINICATTDPCPTNRAMNSEDDFGIFKAEMTLFYQAGVFQDREVDINDEHDKDAITNFKAIAAHELGHSFLSKYKNICYSARHKGTSSPGFASLICETSFLSPECPKAPESVDLMKYYNDSFTFYSDECPEFNGRVGSCENGICCGDLNRLEVVNEDRAMMIMTAGQYYFL